MIPATPDAAPTTAKPFVQLPGVDRTVLNQSETYEADWIAEKMATFGDLSEEERTLVMRLLDEYKAKSASRLSMTEAEDEPKES